MRCQLALSTQCPYSPCSPCCTTFRYVAFGDNLRLFSCAAMAAPNLPWLIATSLPAHTTKPVEQLVL